MTPEEADRYTRRKMQGLARFIKEELPPDWGFVLMTFPFGDPPSRMNYVSNGKREDIIPGLKEFIQRTEDQWSKHIQEDHNG